MPAEIQIIALPMPFGLGSVNCYLLRTSAGFLLIDTGMPTGRASLIQALERAVCRPADLRLVLLTHGDFDHIGNASYLRKSYAAKIAMHPADAGMAERGDMFWNRMNANRMNANRMNANRIIGAIIPVFFRFTRADRFQPDVQVEDGSDLSEYGLAARVVEFPGHSRGSIGVLTAAGDLFCGDLLMNDKATVSLGFGDAADFQLSLEKVNTLKVTTVYPGHGLPFPASQIPR